MEKESITAVFLSHAVTGSYRSSLVRDQSSGPQTGRGQRSIGSGPLRVRVRFDAAQGDIMLASVQELTDLAQSQVGGAAWQQLLDSAVLSRWGSSFQPSEARSGTRSRLVDVGSALAAESMGQDRVRLAEQLQDARPVALEVGV